MVSAIREFVYWSPSYFFSRTEPDLKGEAGVKWFPEFNGYNRIVESGQFLLVPVLNEWKYKHKIDLKGHLILRYFKDTADGPVSIPLLNDPQEGVKIAVLSVTELIDYYYENGTIKSVTDYKYNGYRHHNGKWTSFTLAHVNRTFIGFTHCEHLSYSRDREDQQYYAKGLLDVNLHIRCMHYDSNDRFYPGYPNESNPDLNEFYPIPYYDYQSFWKFLQMYYNHLSGTFVPTVKLLNENINRKPVSPTELLMGSPHNYSLYDGQNIYLRDPHTPWRKPYTDWAEYNKYDFASWQKMIERNKTI